MAHSAALEEWLSAAVPDLDSMWDEALDLLRQATCAPARAELAPPDSPRAAPAPVTQQPRTPLAPAGTPGRAKTPLGPAAQPGMAKIAAYVDLGAGPAGDKENNAAGRRGRGLAATPGRLQWSQRAKFPSSSVFASVPIGDAMRYLS